MIFLRLSWDCLIIFPDYLMVFSRLLDIYLYILWRQFDVGASWVAHKDRYFGQIFRPLNKILETESVVEDFHIALVSQG